MKTKALILTIVVGLLAGTASAHFIPLPVKWSQIPWDPQGTDWTSDCSFGQLMADDFACTDEEKIYAVRWWGSYPSGQTPMPGGHFLIFFHYSTGPHPISVPAFGDPITMYNVQPQEVQVGTDAYGIPVYRCDAYLPVPFDQWRYSQDPANPNPGELFIQITKCTSEGWGWHEVVPPHPILDFAATAQNHFGPWASTYETDMAFELMTPEPGTMALLGLGGLAVVIRRRRSKIRPGGRR